MFKKGDVFQGKHNYYAAKANLKLDKGDDILRMEIIDVKGDIFTIKFSYLFNEDKKKFEISSGAIGFYNKRKDTFKILESPSETINKTGVTNPFPVEVTLIKGQHCHSTVILKLLEVASFTKDNPEGIRYVAYRAELNKIDC